MFKKVFISLFAFMFAFATQSSAAITVDTTALLADVTSVSGSALTVTLAIAAAVVGLMLVKRLIKG